MPSQALKPARHFGTSAAAQFQIVVWIKKATLGPICISAGQPCLQIPPRPRAVPCSKARRAAANGRRATRNPDGVDHRIPSQPCNSKTRKNRIRPCVS